MLINNFLKIHLVWLQLFTEEYNIPFFDLSEKADVIKLILHSHMFCTHIFYSHKICYCDQYSKTTKILMKQKVSNYSMP